MNKVELLKSEKDGLDIRDDIQRYAKVGWESIPEEDIQRLKWYGLFLRHPTPGYFMLRVRIPGGRATSAQIGTLADLAGTYGNGILDLTTRQQFQLRNLNIEIIPEVFRLMEEVGLCSVQTGMDNVRNIMTCPVTGLTTNEMLDATGLVHDLTTEIVGNRAFSNLPRKFNIAITGCLDNCLHLETQDLALVPAISKQNSGEKKGFNVLAGGKLGSGGYRIATPLDIFVEPGRVVELVRAILSVYRDCGFRESRNTARLAFLLDEWGEERFRAAVEERVAKDLARAGRDLRARGVNDHMGIYRQKSPGLNYVGLKVPVGRITSENLFKIARLAEAYGSGELRLTPHQALIIPNVSDKKLGDLTEEPTLKEFVYNPSPVQKGLVSCVGNDYCNLAVIETKSRAVETAKIVEEKLGAELKPITMHWSGCPAGCGNHLVADVGLIGKKTKIKGKVIEAVDVFVGGRSGPNPSPAIKLLEDVPCDVLPEVLSGILPYHSREKMHRSKVRVVKKSPISTEMGTESKKKIVPQEMRGRAEKMTPEHVSVYSSPGT